MSDFYNNKNLHNVSGWKEGLTLIGKSFYKTNHYPHQKIFLENLEKLSKSHLPLSDNLMSTFLISFLNCFIQE